ncbi:hypothetical protein CARUB_v10012270mg, partial [Capsella rubella]
SINEHIDADTYIKFKKYTGNVDGYMLKYNDYNIYLNDALGKINKIADKAIHTWKSEEFIRIYQPDGSELYYKSILAKHNEDGRGGITVSGFETVSGEAKDHVQQEDEDEGGPSKD